MTPAGKRWAAHCTQWLPPGVALETLCAGCPEHRDVEHTPWLGHIMLLDMLQRGGCAFRPDDLTLEQWAGLAEYRIAVEEQARKRKPGAAPGGPPALPR